MKKINRLLKNYDFKKVLDEKRSVANKEFVIYIKENNLSTLIEIDGGVGENNAKEIREAGVDILVAGSAVFRSDDPKRTIKIIRG